MQILVIQETASNGASHPTGSDSFCKETEWLCIENQQGVGNTI
jgi:hypothetical protein